MYNKDINTNNNVPYDFDKDLTTRKILESRSWNYKIFEDYVSLAWYTPHYGEYNFEVDKENALHGISFEAESFNVNDYVKLYIDSLGERGVPESVKELLEDAEAIQKELKTLNKLINQSEMHNTRYELGHLGNLRIYRDNTTDTFLVCRGEGADEEILNEEDDLHAVLHNIAEYYIGLI